MRLGWEVFLGCDILVDGSHTLKNRMWAFIHILVNILANILDSS